MKTYSKDDLSHLERKIKWEKFYAKQLNKANDHKCWFSNPHEREIKRLIKLKKFVELDIKVQDYTKGLILINDKYIVTLLDNKWRVLHKNTWYRHKTDLQHFIDKYILKENKYEN
tara:strand:+ start:348 stop:692 length:345 start_codon:yes stop_codon:yes gene_type:complete